VRVQNVPMHIIMTHKSDCATHNEPHMPNGPCDCGASYSEEQVDAAIKLALFHSKTGKVDEAEADTACVKLSGAPMSLVLASALKAARERAIEPKWNKFPEQPTETGAYIVSFYVHVRSLVWARNDVEHYPHLRFVEHFDPEDGESILDAAGIKEDIGTIPFAWLKISDRSLPLSVYEILPAPVAVLDFGDDLCCVLRSFPKWGRKAQVMCKHGGQYPVNGIIWDNPVWKDFVAPWLERRIEAHNIPAELRYEPHWPV
jgi:hypothetical protein